MGGERILYIEDNFENRILVKLAIRSKILFCLLQQTCWKLFFQPKQSLVLTVRCKDVPLNLLPIQYLEGFHNALQ